jgi:hypothetical protein
MCSIFKLRIDGEEYQRSCRFMHGYPMLPYTRFGKCIDGGLLHAGLAHRCSHYSCSPQLRATQSTEGMVAHHPRSSPFLRILDTAIAQSNTDRGKATYREISYPESHESSILKSLRNLQT